MGEGQRPGPDPESPRLVRRGALVFGPLPPLHRLLLITTVLVVGVASGAWIAHFAAPAAASTAGAGLGAIAGLLLGVVLVHDFSHHEHRPVRVLRRH
jgi:hypothetical protein